MKIQWIGEGSVRLQEKGQRIFLGGSHTHVAKGKFPKFKERDLVFLEHPRDTYPDRVQEALASDDVFVIDGAGEYSYRSVTGRVKSVPKEAGDSTHLISLSFQDMLIAGVSDLDRALNATEVEFLGTPDICFVPVGGNGVMDYKTAVQTINTVQPRIVIPTFFATDNYAVERESIKTFVSEYAVVNPEYHDFVTLKPSDLPSGTTETHLLNLTA